MTREIKFRGKAKLDGKWWFGNLVSKDTRGRTQINNPDYGGCFDIDPNTIGQFTGLYDKNGKEIYEGDIVYIRMNDGSDCNCVIGYDINNLAFGIMDEYAYRSMLDGYRKDYDNEFMLRLYKDSRIFEVIGNIYDNPELLKGGEQ